MKGAFRTSMAWLHTWSGVVVGWVVFLIFLNGTASYFKEEINTWMRPEISAKPASLQSVLGAVEWLKVNAPTAMSWSISVPDARSPVSRVTWRPRPAAGAAPVGDDDDDDDETPADRQAMIDATGKPLVVRETQGGDYFYRFHFALHYVPGLLGAMFIALASVSLLVTIVTGIITHRKIFAEFFTFRPNRGQRSWLDAHTTFAVLALPFHLMITYTGLFVLTLFFMPTAIIANYPSPRAYFAELLSLPEPPKPSGESAPLVPLRPVLDQATVIWHGGRAESIRISNPGDAGSTIDVVRHTGDAIASGARLRFDGVTGMLRDRPASSSPAATVNAAMFGLHEAHFANPTMRWLFFLSGIAATSMVASGLILWTAKRRHQLADLEHPQRGFRLVETLNIAVIAGYPAATAAYFWANRLLPVATPARADVEVRWLFLCWGALLVWALLRPAKRAWAETLGVAAVLFAGLPVVNALTTQRGSIDGLMAGDALYLGFDAASLALGVLFAAAAVQVMRRGSSDAESISAKPNIFRTPSTAESTE